MRTKQNYLYVISSEAQRSREIYLKFFFFLYQHAIKDKRYDAGNRNHPEIKTQGG